MTNRSTREPGNEDLTVPVRAQEANASQQPAAALELVSAKLTDVGRARPHNEDYVDFVVPTDPHQLAAKGSLFLVADGMGGHQAGEVASKSAVEAVIAEYYRDTMHDVPTSLVRAFRLANENLYAQAQADPSKGGMGTTLVAAVVLGRRVYVANVGDSRAYLIDERDVNQITEDHSWVEEQVRVGLLTAEQARRHPQRNLVTRALGSKPVVEVDLFEGEIVAGQTLLLCSDGLTGRVSDVEIANTVRSYPPPDATHRLITAANERGGNDNITVLLIHATDRAAGARAPAGAATRAPAVRPQAGGGTRRPGWIWALAVIAVLMLVGTAAALVATGALSAFLGWETETPGVVEPTSPLSTWTPTFAATHQATDTAEAPTSTLMPVDTTTTVEPITGTVIAETPSPTATVSPTATATPTETHTPTATSTPTVTPWPYPAPTLVGPTDGLDDVAGSITFSWAESAKPLETGDAYQLLIWPEESGDPSNPAIPDLITTTATINVNLDEWLVAGNGYVWTVVIVEESSGLYLSSTDTTRTFFYRGPEDAVAP